MAELPRTHPLQSRAAAWARLPDTVRIRAEPFVAMTNIRISPNGPVVTAALGAELPDRPNTWGPAGSGQAIWLGPDEWLLTSTTERPEQLEARVRAAVRPLRGSAADVSAQWITLRLTGARSRDVLAKGCPLDLHPRSFGHGASAESTLGQAGVVLLALSGRGDDYAILVRSSFAGYLADWLADAALEFTVAPAG